MPQIDPSWQQFLTFIGVVLAALFTYFGVRTTAKANTKMKEIDAAAEIIKEYRDMKNEIKADADQREARMKEDFQAKLDHEREERIKFEQRMMEQLDEVIVNFGIYVKWARDGAEPPPPFIPEWIYSKINNVFNKDKGK